MPFHSCNLGHLLPGWELEHWLTCTYAYKQQFLISILNLKFEFDFGF
jgi:hypothetical protein